MKKGQLVVFPAVCLVVSLLSAFAQEKGKTGEVKLQTNTQVSNKSFTPDEVIRQFTTKESELREVWKEYSYLQESKMQRIGPGNTVASDFYQVSEFVFNDAGKRIQRILRYPPSTLEQEGILTAEDKNALINLQPFALASEDVVNYNINYVGKEKVDELNTYVFDVIPKVMSNPRELDRMRKQKIEGKYFLGKIWVDDQDLQIVKTKGKVVPEFKQRFPIFETYRENIDGRYWFPTYTYGDDVLEFEEGGKLHIRMVIKYKNYRRFQSDVKLTGVDEIVDEPKKPEEQSKSAPAQTKPGEVKKDDAKKEETNKSKPQRP